MPAGRRRLKRKPKYELCFCNKCKGQGRPLERTTIWVHRRRYGSLPRESHSDSRESAQRPPQPEPVIMDERKELNFETDVLEAEALDDSSESQDENPNDQASTVEGNNEPLQEDEQANKFQYDMEDLSRSLYTAHLEGVPQTTIVKIAEMFADVLNPYLPCTDTSYIPQTWYKIKQVARVQDDEKRHDVVHCGRCSALTRCSVLKSDDPRYMYTLNCSTNKYVDLCFITFIFNANHTHLNFMIGHCI